MTYFVEKEASQWTFLDSFWYSLMTLTTVGYELQPQSTSGKLVGGLCALLGIFILTLPLPIVVNRQAVKIVQYRESQFFNTFFLLFSATLTACAAFPPSTKTGEERGATWPGHVLIFRLWRNEVATKKTEKLKSLANTRSDSEYDQHLRRKLSSLQE